MASVSFSYCVTIRRMDEFMPKLPRQGRRLWGAAAFGMLLWYLEFAYQYYMLNPGLLGLGLVRSFGFAGTTLISASLLAGVVFKFYPRTAIHWRLRRHLGVAGFVFICFHVAAALKYYFSYDLAVVYYSWNPFVNPIVFGTIAFPIFFVMAVTSTDWAVRKLRRWWKRLHRLVYLAMLASVFHFMIINHPALLNVAGYVLIVFTAATLLGQLYWFLVIASRKKFRSLGAVAGWVLIVAAGVAGYLAYLGFR